MYNYLHRIIFNYITYTCFVAMDKIDNDRPTASIYLSPGYT